MASLERPVNRQMRRESPASLQECTTNLVKRRVVVDQSPQTLVLAEVAKLGTDRLAVVDPVNILLDIKDTQFEIFDDRTVIGTYAVKASFRINAAGCGVGWFAKNSVETHALARPVSETQPVETTKDAA